MKNLKIFLIAAALALSCAIFVCFVSNNLWSRFEHRQDVINEQFAILKGEPWLLGGDVYYWPTFQNRVLFAYGLKFFSGLGILPVSKWYLLLRLFTAFIAFIIFFFTAVKAGGSRLKTASAGMLFLAYQLVLSFNHGYEHPPDFLDVAFICLFLWSSLRARPILLLAFALLASLNRESSVFAGVIWFFANGVDEKLKPRPLSMLYGVLVSIASYAAVVMIRLALGGDKIVSLGGVAAGLPHLIARFKEFLYNPTNSSWPVLLAAMLVPLVLWIWSNRRSLTGLDIRLLMASMVIIIMTLPWARMNELRTFLPAMTVAVYVATVGEKGCSV